MISRFQLFMDAQGISQAQLADAVNVTRASISHIMSGRNKPNFEFLQNLSDAFPSLNLDWLITGNGSMIKDKNAENRGLANEQNSVQKSVNLKTISKIMVFYSDGSYEELSKNL